MRSISRRDCEHEYLSLCDKGDLLHFVKVAQDHIVRVVLSGLESAHQGNHHVRVFAVLPGVRLDASLAFDDSFCLRDSEVAAESVKKCLE